MAEIKEKTIDKMKKLPIVGRQPKGEKEEKILREMGEYEFYNLEEPGLCLKFPYGNTTNKINFAFFHGEKYQIPRHVARHLESCTTPIWDWRPDGTGRMTKQKIGERPRFQMRQVYS